MIWPFVKKTPHRIQLEPVECGAVCLGIILEYLGKNVINSDLRDKANVSRSGSSAHNIIKAAQSFGLTGYAEKILAVDLKLRKIPSILFFDQCHFVVFEGAFGGRYYINDPAVGRYSLAKNDFTRRFSRINIHFVKDTNFKEDDFADRRNKFAHMTSFKCMMIALGVGAGALYSLAAFVVSHFLSNALGEKDQGRFMLSFGLFIVLMLSLIVSAIFWGMTRHVATSRFKREFFGLKQGLLAAPLDLFDDLPFSRFSDQFLELGARSIEKVQSLASTIFLLSFGLVLFLLILLMSPSMALGCFFTFVAFLAQKWLRAPSEDGLRKQEHHVAFKKAMEQGFDMRAMGQEHILLDSLLANNLSTYRVQNKVPPYIKAIMLSPIVPCMVLLMVFWLIAASGWPSGSLSSPELFSMLMLVVGFCSAAAPLTLRNDDIGEAMTQALQRELFAGTQSSQPIIVPHENSAALLRLSSISYSFPGDDHEILRDIDIDILRSSVVGVIGNREAQVSTLLRIIANRLHPKTGAIKHFVSDGMPAKIALIEDDTDLPGGTLKDVVTIFDASISEQEIIQSLQHAGALNLFYRRPMGLLMPIQNHGGNISMGEKKRLLLAQALVHKPDLIILDNFFDILDETVSSTIIDNLCSLNIAVLFSSYRSAELRRAHHVVVVNDGGILSIDNHDKLMQTSSLYQELVTKSTGGDR